MGNQDRMHEVVDVPGHVWGTQPPQQLDSPDDRGPAVLLVLRGWPDAHRLAHVLLVESDNLTTVVPSAIKPLYVEASMRTKLDDFGSRDSEPSSGGNSHAERLVLN